VVPEESENLFTLREVRQLTSLTTHELKEYIKRGALRIRQEGRKGVLTQKEVLEFLDKVGLEPKWEKLQDRPQRSLSGLFSRMAGKRGLRTSEAFGFSILIHVVFLFIFGLVIGLIGGSEVSRFITFSLETTTAVIEVENPVDKKNPELVKRKEEVRPSAEERNPPPRQQIKAKIEAPAVSEIAPPEKELLPIVAKGFKLHTFAPKQIMEKKKEEAEGPFLIPTKKPADVMETTFADEKSEADNESKKESIADTSAGLIAAKPGPYRPGMGVTPPRLIYKVTPQYPKIAVDSGVKGSVELEIIVKADGSVGDIKVLDLPREDLDFDLAAIEAVQQWKFLPGRFQGQPVDVVAIITVNFKMDD